MSSTNLDISQNIIIKQNDNIESPEKQPMLLQSTSDYILSHIFNSNTDINICIGIKDTNSNRHSFFTTLTIIYDGKDIIVKKTDHPSTLSFIGFKSTNIHTILFTFIDILHTANIIKDTFSMTPCISTHNDMCDIIVDNNYREYIKDDGDYTTIFITPHNDTKYIKFIELICENKKWRYTNYIPITFISTIGRKNGYAMHYYKTCREYTLKK